MKKRVSFFAVLLAVLTMLVPNVKATSFEGKTTASKPFGFGDLKWKSYDAERNINYYTVEITVDDTVVNTVLNQKPGNTNQGGEAPLSMFFLGIVPELPDTNFNKNSVNYKDGNVEVAQEKLNNKLDTVKDSSTSKGFWVPYFLIQYKDGEKWATTTQKGTGSTSIKANLMEELGLDDESKLVYGVNYRFYMVDNLQYLIGWEYKDGEDVVREYANVSYDIKLPISGKSGNNEYYFPSLETAMKSDVNMIVINEDVEITDDLEIKEGKTVTVKEGVTLTVAAGKTLTNKGIIENDGTIVGDITNDGNVYNYGDITGNIVNNEGKTVSSEGTITGNITSEGNVYNSGKVIGDVVSDGNFYNEGTVSGEIKTSDGAKLYKVELPKGTEIGGIGVQYNMVIAGKTVTLYPYLYADGYEFRNLKVTYKKDGKDVEIKLTKKTEDGETFYTFEMPAGDVKVTASIEKIKNPETYDGILGYAVTGVASVLGLIALVIATKYSKREN